MHEMSSSSSRPVLPPLRSNPPTSAQRSAVSSGPQQRKVTHIPPPPIPQWALATRPAVAAAVHPSSIEPTDAGPPRGGGGEEEETHPTTKSPILPPPQATIQASQRTPSGLEQTTRPTALLASASVRGSPRIRTPDPKILPVTTSAGHPGPDSRGPLRGRPKGSKNRKALVPSDSSKRPRPKRVDARPDYRVRKTREQQPKRSARSSSPSPRDVYDKLEPLFLQFFCEWEGCRAELDSFTKLKKHIVVAHGGEVRGNKRCKWGKCSHPSDEASMTTLPKVFDLVEDLLSHVDSRHLNPILWHMGDGRHGHGIVTNDASKEYHPAYLFWNGYQVTPSVQHQQLEAAAEMRERQRKLRQILDQAYANAPAIAEGDLEDYAEEMLSTDPG